VLMPGRGIPEPSLLRTHPETAERIGRLMSLKAAGVGQDPLRLYDAPVDRHWGMGNPVMRPPRWHVNGLWH
jgi:heat shock protein HtpX